MSEQESNNFISVLNGVKHLLDQTIERDNNNNNNPGETPKGLSSADRRFIVQLLLCVVTLICIPLFIVLFLLSSDIGSIMAVSLSVLFLGCCCCMACGNVYWVKKTNTGYQQIQ